MPRRFWIALFILPAWGCQEELVDEATACVVEADERVVVEVRWPCGSDHRGAELSCSFEAVDAEERTWRLRSRFRDGEDPNGACADDLVKQCVLEDPGTGEITILYGEAEFILTVPDANVPVCLDPSGQSLSGTTETSDTSGSSGTGCL